MGAEGLPERLSELPGVVTCAVDDDVVTLEVSEGTDVRLLRARAEAVCAAAGDARTVAVVVGDPPAPAAAIPVGGAALWQRAGGAWRGAVARATGVGAAGGPEGPSGATAMRARAAADTAATTPGRPARCQRAAPPTGMAAAGAGGSPTTTATVRASPAAAHTASARARRR
ncbi:MAG TPA: hypothetical protein VM263_02020, partial [Acidimicrobiales bacterium]|nr:hypothetical protein [Acidimicrobiales bacterium]